MSENPDTKTQFSHSFGYILLSPTRGIALGLVSQDIELMLRLGQVGLALELHL